MAIEDYYIALTVRSTSQASDDYGDVVTSYGEPREITGVIANLTQAQTFAYAQRGIDVDATLFAPVDSGVEAFDIVSDGEQFYQVIGNPVDHMQRGHHIEAALHMLRGFEANADTD